MGLDLNPAMEVGNEGVLDSITTLGHAFSISENVGSARRNFSRMTLGNDESHPTH